MKYMLMACDPGGYDVVFPIFIYLNDGGYDSRLILLKSAARINPEFACDENAYNEIMFEYLVEGDILITGTSYGNDLELEAILECKSRNVITISILDYWNYYLDRFKTHYGSIVFPDMLFVMDDMAKDEAIDAGVDSSIIRIVGHPGLDKYINTTIPPVGCNDVIFISTPISQVYGDCIGYTEFDVTEDIYEVCKKTGLNLNIKFHPKQTDDYKSKYSEYAVNLQMEEIVRDYKIIISTYSIALLQCYLMGGNVISYQPNLQYKDLCITDKLGITRRIDSKADLQNEIQRKYTCVSEGVSNIIWMDGKSTERCAKIILSM